MRGYSHGACERGRCRRIDQARLRQRRRRAGPVSARTPRIRPGRKTLFDVRSGPVGCARGTTPNGLVHHLPADDRVKETESRSCPHVAQEGRRTPRVIYEEDARGAVRRPGVLELELSKRSRVVVERRAGALGKSGVATTATAYLNGTYAASQKAEYLSVVWRNRTRRTRGTCLLTGPPHVILGRRKERQSARERKCRVPHMLSTEQPTSSNHLRQGAPLFGVASMGHDFAGVFTGRFAEAERQATEQPARTPGRSGSGLRWS